ncbi:MAG: hypothetical protein ACOYN4_11440 [Bacteroidales bacterium]
MEANISLEYINTKYPGFNITYVEQFKRSSGVWRSRIGFTEIKTLGTPAQQIKSIIENQGAMVCLRLFNIHTGEVLRPDIETNKFIISS